MKKTTCKEAKSTQVWLTESLEELPSFLRGPLKCHHLSFLLLLFSSFLYLYQGTTVQICNKWVPGKHLVSMCDLRSEVFQWSSYGILQHHTGSGDGWRWELTVWIWGRLRPVGPHFWKAVLAQEFNQSGCHHGCASAWWPRTSEPIRAVSVESHEKSQGKSNSRSLPCTSSPKNQRRKRLENRSIVTSRHRKPSKTNRLVVSFRSTLAPWPSSWLLGTAVNPTHGGSNVMRHTLCILETHLAVCQNLVPLLFTSK